MAGTPRKSFTTSKGLELPLLNHKNKEYLQVMHRIQWFRSEHPTGILKTTMLSHQGEGQTEYAVFKTEVYVDTDRGPMCIATGHKKETRAGFDDFMEKAETGSIGRALALCGYGTVFAADEFEEGNRLADSPVPILEKTTSSTSESTSITTASSGRKPSFRKNISAVASAGDDI